ncbi:uncharacterized protein LOC119263450 isoform X2 [Pygocentrus nattereri]|uniref:uncharacterized protein LOC119261911 isoform X2 n=1 Tax=Pygocentrus nattereri TaxID=42514 RepID=UPI0008144403|nr:uncharacterized protein LOC119261911 isoform X2 [Pygocentrus nattereri]XP_037394221.1 uncharacterized protein LOC119263450 isoform X2 [Pygocentrus nattereri]
MLVPVEYKEVRKWVRVSKKEDVYDYSEFITEILTKFGLPKETHVDLKDSSGIDVDSDIFDELVKSSQVSFVVSTEESSDERQSSSESSFCSEESASSGSTLILESTKARRRQLIDGPVDLTTARDIVKVALHSKPGGDQIFQEYHKTSGLSDGTRRKMVNILVADMVEGHGRIPPVNVRISYALGIITLFPHLKDLDSVNGYEHYYDPQSGSGYLAWRLKTVQRSSASEGKSGSTSSYKGGPKTHREMPVCGEQLSGDECKEAMSLMNHSPDKTVVKDKMKATFKHRQKLVHDPEKTSVILDLFPRFLDTTGLVAQDFTLLFGEEVSGRFLAKWPTIFKPKIIADCKTIPSNSHVDDLLALAFQESDHGWHSDLACILLLLHLLPPTSKGKKMGKISASEAEDRLVKFMRVGMSMVAFLEKSGSAQPYLLCVGEKKNSIHNYYIILDQRAVPCEAKTAVAAFDELFKAHFVFAVSYDEALNNFFTFIQTTVYGIDVGKAKESPRVKEIRVRLLRRDL